MVNENYLLVAENLVDRNKNRLNLTRSPRQQETDRLFYWIMRNLELCVEGCCPAKKYHYVSVTKTRSYDDGSVLLSHERVSNYLSQYVKEQEFYSVMEDVANIFNEIGKSEEKGYKYSANFYPKTCSLIVRMYAET